METKISDTEIVDTEPEVTAEDIAKMFDGYKAPAIVENNDQKNDETHDNGTIQQNDFDTGQTISETSSISSTKDAPYGYFDNGKPRKRPKKGEEKESQKVQEAKIDAGIMIDGAMFLMMVNMLIPLILSSVNNYFSKTKVKPEAIEMTEKQESKFAPLVDRCLKGIEMKGNPQSLLMFGLLTIFGVNFINARMEAEVSNL